MRVCGECGHVRVWVSVHQRTRIAIVIMHVTFIMLLD